MGRKYFLFFQAGFFPIAIDIKYIVDAHPLLSSPLSYIAQYVRYSHLITILGKNILSVGVRLFVCLFVCLFVLFVRLFV